jgi:acetyl esterase/lipase
MNAGRFFTEKYLKLMFKQLRDATPEEVMEELEHCRRENRRPVRVPRYFRGFFTEEKYTASTGFEMQVFKHEETARSLSSSKLRSLSPEPVEGSKGRPNRELILYLHGGAFIYPPVFFHLRFLHDLALRTHYDALLPVYPKSPEYDCEYSVKTLLEYYKSISESRQYDEIHLVGDSAGACLCLVVAQEAHKNDWQKPKTSLLLSPCVDLSHTKEKEMLALQDRDTMLQYDRIVTLNAIWQGNLPVKHPWVSPVFGDFSGVDDLYVYYGSNEILQPDDLFLKETYEKAGKTGRFSEYEGMFHTFAMFPIPEGFKALKEMVSILKR